MFSRNGGVFHAEVTPAVCARHHLLPLASFTVCVTGGRSTGDTIAGARSQSTSSRCGRVYIWTLAAQTNDQRVLIIVYRPRILIYSLLYVHAL